MNINTAIRLLLLSASMMFFFVSAHAQYFIKKNEYYDQLVNGMKLLTVVDPAATHTEVLLTINAGTAHENFKTKGTASAAAALTDEKINQHKFQGCEHQVLLSSDYVIYRFSFTENSKLKELMDVVSQVINYFPKDTNELKTAFARHVQFYDSFTPNNTAEENAIKLIYGTAAFRAGISQYGQTVNNISAENIDDYKKSFYCPSNTFMVVYGNYSQHDIYKIATSKFLNWDFCNKFSQPTTPKLINTTLYNAQLIQYSTDNAETNLQIVQPSAVFLNSHRDILSAMLFSILLNDSSSALRKYMADSMGIYKAAFDYFPTRYINTSKLIFYADTPALITLSANYNKTDYLKDVGVYSEIELNKAKQKLINRFNYSNNQSYLLSMAKYSSITSLNLFCKIQDSISVLNTADIKRFVTKYLCENNFVSILNISEQEYKASGMDSIYTQTAHSVSEYEFRFAKNTNLFELSQGDSVLPYNVDSILLSLSQWVKINPLKVIKINGVASDDELLFVRDDELLNFFRNYPEFQFAPENSVTTKKIRLDVYRSMTVIKRLLESGVSINQLTGTGNLIKAQETKNGSGQRVYCTIKVL